MAFDQYLLIKLSMISLVILLNPVNVMCVARHLTELESGLDLLNFASASSSYQPPEISPSSSNAPTEAPEAKAEAEAETESSIPNGKGLLNNVVSRGPINLQVQKLCEGVEYPAICISTLSPIFTGNAEPLVLIETLTKAVMNEVKAANATVAKMYSMPGADIGAVDQCCKVYDDALYDLNRVIESIKENDIPTIQTMLSSSITMAGTCDDGFTGQPDPEATGVSPMAAINELLINMAANILSIANKIPSK